MSSLIITDDDKKEIISKMFKVLSSSIRKLEVKGNLNSHDIIILFTEIIYIFIDNYLITVLTEISKEEHNEFLLATVKMIIKIASHHLIDEEKIVMQ